MYNNDVVLTNYLLHESVEKGQAEPVEADSLTRELLDTNKCYILDCGVEVFVWMGRNTSLDERKSASGAAEVILYPIFNMEIIECLQ
jgi:gelsolin